MGGGGGNEAIEEKLLGILGVGRSKGPVSMLLKDEGILSLMCS